MRLTDEQLQAIDKMMDFMSNPDQKYFVLEGYSGCGKTTLIDYFLKALDQRADILRSVIGGRHMPDVYVTATTNKAASALTEKLTDYGKAETIHSTLGLVTKPNYSTGGMRLMKSSSFKIFSNSLFIIDEASMIDEQLLKFIDEALGVKTKVILVGDPKQLLSVQGQQPLVFNLDFPKACLTKVMRQQGTSTIPDFGAKMRQYLDDSPMLLEPLEYTPDIIQCTGEEFKDLIDTNFNESNWKNHNHKILAWRNDTVIGYNNYVRSLHTDSKLYLPGEVLVANSPIMDSANQSIIYRNESKVILGSSEFNHSANIHNVDCDTYMTDLGHYIYVPKDMNHYKAMLKYYAREKMWFEYHELKNIVADVRPLHASTIHKAQGSTFDQVYINLSDIGKCTHMSDIVRMMYVGFTRATDKVYVFGNLPSRCFKE